MEPTKPTVNDDIEELEEKIAEVRKRRAAQAQKEHKPWLVQNLKDQLALADLEDEHGPNRVWSIEFEGWKAEEGAATLIVVLLPTRSEKKFKKFQQLVLKNRERAPQVLTAIEQLARTCVVYPHPEEQKELYTGTVELAAGILSEAADFIGAKLRGQAEEDSKK